MSYTTRRRIGPSEASMAPGLTIPEWEGTGPCVKDPELFFNPANYAVTKAKAICGRCPFRVQCLAGALERKEPWGVFGGELFPDASWARKKSV